LLQFSFTPLAAAEVEEILGTRTEMNPRTAGSPRSFLKEVRACHGIRSRGRRKAPPRLPDGPRTFARTARRLEFVCQHFRARQEPEVAFENVLEVFYSLLTDLLDLSCSPSPKVLRNPNLRKELDTLGKKVDIKWISKAVEGFDCASRPAAAKTSTGLWAWMLWPYSLARPRAIQEVPSCNNIVTT